MSFVALSATIPNRVASFAWHRVYDMQMNKATLQLKKGKILPLVLKLTIPAVVAQLITFMYNIVDRIYVDMMPEHETDALAALGIVLPITLILTAFANLADRAAQQK